VTHISHPYVKYPNSKQQATLDASLHTVQQFGTRETIQDISDSSLGRGFLILTAVS